MEKNKDELSPRRRYWTVLLAGEYMIVPDTAEAIYLTEKEAIDFAIEEAKEEAGSEYYIYECRPIKRVRWRKVKIEDVEEEKGA